VSNRDRGRAPLSLVHAHDRDCSQVRACARRGRAMTVTNLDPFSYS
jgi:hypothetical protein